MGKGKLPPQRFSKKKKQTRGKTIFLFSNSNDDGKAHTLNPCSTFLLYCYSVWLPDSFRHIKRKSFPLFCTLSWLFVVRRRLRLADLIVLKKRRRFLGMTDKDNLLDCAAPQEISEQLVWEISNCETLNYLFDWTVELDCECNAAIPCHAIPCGLCRLFALRSVWLAAKLSGDHTYGWFSSYLQLMSQGVCSPGWLFD